MYVRVCICWYMHVLKLYSYVLICICLYETKLAYWEDYHVRSLPFEWHGMNGLLSQPIPVIDFDTGEELQGASHVRHVGKPFQHRLSQNGSGQTEAVGACHLTLAVAGWPPNWENNPE